MSSSAATVAAETARTQGPERAISNVHALLDPRSQAPVNAEIVSLDVALRRFEPSSLERLERASQGASEQTLSEGFGRAVECFLSGMLLLVFSPLMIVVTLFLLRSGGTPFFGHRRVGRNGKNFRCLKFRTMKIDAEARLQEVLKRDPVARDQWARDHKLKNDPRITRLGKFLRQSSLDELPQMINVFRGEMSLVGPRPIVIDEIDKYGPRFSELVSVRPGITGLWQVSGRNDITYRRRKALDILYIRRKTLGFDLRILLKTVSVVLRRCGAY
jgi:lipopolysaccharide/colanic/teichoic acid biosynthesis glycosyltransferase